MKTIRLILIAVALLMVIPSITSCKDDDKDEPGGSIVGTWKYTEDGGYEIITFNSDGTYKVFQGDYGAPGDSDDYYDEEYGNYSVSGNVFTLIDERGYEDSTPFSIDGNKLIIYDSDGDIEGIYYRQ